MGNSARAIVGYGYVFPEGTELPWESEEFYDDIESWWLKECGYVRVVPWEELFTENGEYAPTYTKERWEEEWKNRSEFLKKHPIPVEIAYFGHHDYPDTGVFVPGATQGVRWDSAEELKDFRINGSIEKEFMYFIEKYKLSEDAPKWLIGAYYG